MRFLSVCSGIEAASMAWQPLGWHAAAFSEIEPFPSAVLAHHYPNVPNLGDMTQYEQWPHDLSIDLLCGGTPCQSFSVAGLRKGLDDPRGNLMLTFGAIAAKYRPQWLVWENVPGVLSSNGGRDFGAFLGMLGQLGYGFAYRVLDAQYFGVAQRRRRVFVVGCAGNWRAAAAVLFERHSLQGHPAPSRSAGQSTAHDVAPSLVSSGRGVSRTGETRGQDPVIAQCLTTGTGQRYDAETETLLPIAFVQNTRNEVRLMGGDGSLVGALAAETGAKQQCYIAQPAAYGIPGNWIGRKPENGGNGLGFDIETSYTLTKTDVHGVAYQPIAFEANMSLQQPTTNGLHPTLTRRTHASIAAFKGGQGSAAGGIGYDEHLSPTLSAADSGSNRTPALLQHMQVRRLTPKECERLQGFPDDYTAIPWRKKPASECPDGPRYKALGNSWAVPNVHWIGERINAVRAVLLDQKAAA